MSFDVLAPHYRWMEAILAGEKLQRCRTAFLGEISDAQRILICGEGAGLFLRECHRRMPLASIVVLDSSPRMLELCRISLQRRSFNYIEFVCADALTFGFHDADFDVVATHFFLDCFNRMQLEKLIRRLAQAVSPSAKWLISDFAIPARGLPRLRAIGIHWLMYRFFRRFTGISAEGLTVPDVILNQEGFRCFRRRTYDWGLLKSELWARQPPHSATRPE